MSKRFTDTEIWDKEWFMVLSPKLKCLVKFVRDKCSSVGIWKPNLILAKTYIGEAITIDELLQIDDGKQFNKLSNGDIYCAGFIEFQYGKLSQECRPHIKLILTLEKYPEQDRVLIGYSKGIHTLQEKDKEKEKDKEEIKGVQGVNFKPSDLKKYFQESPAYRDKICIAHKLSPQELSEKFEEFFKDQEAKETLYPNRRDATIHFGNWLKLNKPKSKPVSAFQRYANDQP